MSQFNRTPGNTRHEVLRQLIESPRYRVQRILEVTRILWSTEQALDASVRGTPAFGPGGRVLVRAARSSRRIGSERHAKTAPMPVCA
jgi:hypothetical protein